tara:strand:- start:2201 stop:4429 length:2229 start_codon:yes stop_codon:yes gene_type:complete
MNYIFDFNNRYNLDKHIIDKLRIDEIGYIISCFQRYNETRTADKNNIKYLINHTYLFLIDSNDGKIFSQYIENQFDTFYDFILFFDKYSNDTQKEVFYGYLYSSINTNDFINTLKLVILLEIKNFLKYIIKWETIKNITIKNINNTILGRIILNKTTTSSLHYINIILEYKFGKDYLLNWFNLFYKVYNSLLINIHTETLLDIDIYHKLKKVYIIVDELWNNMLVPKVINTSVLFTEDNFLGFKQYDSPIVSSYDKNIEQPCENNFNNKLLFTYHRYNEMLTLLHLSKYITLNENKNKYVGEDTIYSNINIIINFFSNELFFTKVYDTFKFYDKIINIILYTYENNRDQYKCIPDSFIRSIFDLVMYIDKSERYSHFKLLDFKIFLPNIAKLCYLFIEDKDSISNPHIRMNSICILDLLSINDIYIEPKIIDSLIDVFIQLETFQTVDSFYDKFRYRKFIFMVIQYNFYNESFKKYFINHINSLPKLKLTRIFYLLFNDFNFMIEDLFQKINDKHIYIDFDDHVNKELTILMKYQVFLCLGLEFCNIDDILLDNYILTKFVYSLNYNINLILETKYDFIMDHYKITELYFSMVGLYEHFRFNEEFIDTLIKDIRSFSFKFIYDIKKLFIKLTYKEHLPSVLDINIINDIINKIVSYTKRIEYPEDNNDSLIDPITFEPISNPVILPSSGMILDKWTICNHLLSNESDPFNREKLTIEILEEYNLTEEAKNKIKQFKDSNINE